ncbi:MAG: hypothetical protein ACYC0X_15120 [Pirellulaceae bacterium]
MKRLLSLTLAVAVLGIWLVPSSADAGFLQRLFGRRVQSTNAVVQPAQTEAGTYRRGSYEPTVGSRSANSLGRSYRTTERKKDPWDYPKWDSRRYSGGAN